MAYLMLNKFLPKILVFPLNKLLLRNAGYIVLIPEIGEDLPEKGSLIQPDGLPEFSSITVEKCMAAVGVQALDLDKGVREIEERLEVNPDSNVFTHIFQPLEILGAPLNLTWGLSKALYLGNNTSMPTNNYLLIHEHAKRARCAKYNSKNIYEASKKALIDGVNKEEKSKEDVRLLKKYILEGKLNGLELEESKQNQLFENRKKLVEEECKFRKKVEIATAQFKHVIDDYAMVRDYPKDLLRRMSRDWDRINEGPWEVRLYPQIYNRFMEYCPDRSVRMNAWLAMVTRGAVHRSKELMTSVHLEQIRALRRDQAAILGYGTYADVSMETKMAGDVSKVRDVIKSLRQISKPVQDEEIKRLHDFAVGNGFEGDKIELWDFPYWNRKMTKALFDLDEEKIKENFPIDKVLTGLFSLTESLLNVRIVRRNEAQVWHKDVKYYDVYDESITGEPFAGFYLDLFDDGRTTSIDKSFMVAIQNKSTFAKSKPLTALIFNFDKERNGKNGKKDVFLTLKQVEMLFNRFGHGLQHLLTRANYSEVSGVSNIEWDVVATSGHVYTYFLNDRNVLKSISGNTISDDLIEAIENGRKSSAATELCKELYLSALDIELHTSKLFWLDVVKKLWPKFRTFPLDKFDSHPCSFVQIFTEGWASAYYSNFWSKMLAADVYGAFVEEKEEEGKKTIAKRYRDTFLAFGGGRQSGEVFRTFRGRDFCYRPFLKSLGIGS